MTHILTVSLIVRLRGVCAHLFLLTPAPSGFFGFGGIQSSRPPLQYDMSRVSFHFKPLARQILWTPRRHNNTSRMLFYCYSVGDWRDHLHTCVVTTVAVELQTAAGTKIRGK